MLGTVMYCLRVLRVPPIKVSSLRHFVFEHGGNCLHSSVWVHMGHEWKLLIVWIHLGTCAKNKHYCVKKSACTTWSCACTASIFFWWFFMRCFCWRMGKWTYSCSLSKPSFFNFFFLFSKTNKKITLCLLLKKRNTGMFYLSTGLLHRSTSKYGEGCLFKSSWWFFWPMKNNFIQTILTAQSQKPVCTQAQLVVFFFK